MQPDSAAPLSPADRFFEFAYWACWPAVSWRWWMGLDTPTTVIAAAALIIRALIAFRPDAARGARRVVTAVTLADYGFTPSLFLHLRRFVPSVVHLVFFVAVHKILTAKTNRDYLF